MGRALIKLHLLAITLLSTASALPSPAIYQERDALEAMFTCSMQQPVSLCCKQVVQSDGTVSDCEQSMQVVLGQGDANSLTMTNVNTCSAEQQNGGYLNVACCESQHQEQPGNSTYLGSQCTHASLTNVVRRQATLETRTTSERLLDDPDAVGITRPPVAIKRHRKGVMQGIDVSRAPRIQTALNNANAGVSSNTDKSRFLVVRRRQETEDSPATDSDGLLPSFSGVDESPVLAKRAEGGEAPSSGLNLRSWPILSRFSTIATSKKPDGPAKGTADVSRSVSTADNVETEFDTGAGRFVQDTADTTATRSDINQEKNKRLPSPELPARSSDCDSLGMCVRNPARVIIRRSRMARKRSLERRLPSTPCRLGADGRCVDASA